MLILWMKLLFLLNRRRWGPFNTNYFEIISKIWETIEVMLIYIWLWRLYVFCLFRFWSEDLFRWWKLMSSIESMEVTINVYKLPINSFLRSDNNSKAFFSFKKIYNNFCFLCKLKCFFRWSFLYNIFFFKQSLQIFPLRYLWN